MTTWKYFTMEELTRSDVAKKLKINNIPNDCVTENLDALVVNVLDPLRDYLGCPLRVSSGYRCEELNRLVGGVKNSQHMSGEAADIQPIGMKWKVFIEKVNQWAENNDFDQLILERSGVARWVHISYSRKRNRRASFKIIRRT